MGYTEEQIQEVMLELCAGVSGRIAKSMQGYKKDAEMICRRVVNEHMSDMMDAASVGEDVQRYCKENKVCPMSNEQFNSMVKMAAEAMAESEAEKETAKMKEHSEDEEDL